MIYQEDFLAAKCDNPDCNHYHDHQFDDFWIHSVCHPQSPTWCVTKQGRLLIICSICMQIIDEIAVATRPI